jgi:hypothetical protein
MKNIKLQKCLLPCTATYDVFISIITKIKVKTAVFMVVKLLRRISGPKRVKGQETGVSIIRSSIIKYYDGQIDYVVGWARSMHVSDYQCKRNMLGKPDIKTELRKRVGRCRLDSSGIA